MLLAPAFAQTGAWTSPVVLSTGGEGWEAAAAIDGNGNSVALWDERTSVDHALVTPETERLAIGGP